LPFRIATAVVIAAALALPTTQLVEAQAAGTVVLGGKAFAPKGEGWGTEQPRTIFNGGDPSGLITGVRWITWGGESAVGWGKNAIFKPRGGYYRRPVAIKLKASRIGSCAGRRAYTRLSFREPTRPGGPLGPWRLWSGARTICRPPY
jgi:hypothetical protein